jgi:hypothetical protein
MVAVRIVHSFVRWRVRREIADVEHRPQQRGFRQDGLRLPGVLMFPSEMIYDPPVARMSRRDLFGGSQS